MRRRPLIPVAVAVLSVALAACLPMKDPPPAAPTPPPLPAAPTGIAATPALLATQGSPDQPLGAPDPDVISVDPSWCAFPPAPPSTTTTTTTPGTPSACYYAYSTPTIRFLPTGVPVYRSTDLVHWEAAGPPDVHGNASGIAFDGDLPAGEFPLWAPSVLQTGPNRFVMWVSEKSTVMQQMCLWSATAISPDGPFTFTGHGPYCDWMTGGLIDPAFFVDGGTTYLTYKGEGMTSPAVPARVFSSPLTATGDAISGWPATGTEHQLLEVLPAPSFEYPIVEAPTLMRAPDGTLFLFYSANDWFTADYAVGVARCDSPIGPCNRIYSTPVLASRGAMVGPGGQTPFRDAAGNWQLAFHAWDPADLAAPTLDGSLRSLRFLPITFPNGNPKVG